MKLNKIESVFLTLLKGSVRGVEHYRNFEALSVEEWVSLYLLAEREGMVPVLMGEIEKLGKVRNSSESSDSVSCLPPMDLLMEWLGQSNYRETTYQKQYEESCEFADALAKEGVKCLVLKGLAVGNYYPVKNAREFGDLDCFLINANLNANPNLLAFEKGNEIGRQLGAKVEQAGYKHTHIRYKDLLIENHEYLTNFNETKQGVVIEKTMRQLALEGGEKRIGDTNLWIPNPEFNVLFLLKHSLGDFIANDMTIKAVYDWAVFLKVEQDNIDWKRMEKLLDECRLRNFFELMTEAAMTYLGLETRCGGMAITSHRRMVDWLMEDVLDLPRSNGGKKTLYVKAKRLLDRVRRMVKYHRLLNDRIHTLLWTMVAYRPVFRQKVRL